MTGENVLKSIGTPSASRRRSTERSDLPSARRRATVIISNWGFYREFMRCLQIIFSPDEIKICDVMLSHEGASCFTTLFHTSARWLMLQA